MQEIYFDNSATTRLCCSSVAAMEEAMKTNFANPSSKHRPGFLAEQMLEQARGRVLSALGVKNRADKLVFTASGTEANNLALAGSAFAKEKNKGGTIVLTDSEHASVYNCAKHLEKQGFNIRLLPTRGGKIDPAHVLSAIDEHAFLLSIMHVNNEHGAVYDVSTIFRAAKRKKPDLITHTDAVQSFMKLPFTPQGLGADLVTLSAHKIHGPKGAGALYVSEEIIKRKCLSPVLFGGGQELGLRSGTENTISIAGFGAAAAENAPKLKEHLLRAQQVRTALVEHLPNSIQVNSAEKTSPFIISLTLPDIKSETMLHYLSGRGIYVSSGSACSSNTAGKISRTLKAFGLSERQADCTIRLSLSSENTVEEACIVAGAISDGCNELVQMQ